MRLASAPPMTRRLAAFLVAEGHEEGTALDLSRNMVRKWWATGTDLAGRKLSKEVLEACRAEVLATEEQGLSEAAALGMARARPGGRTMRNSQRRVLADQLGHRAAIAEGLLMSAKRPTERTLAAATRLLGEAEEHRKIKCPKCDLVQSATHKKCSRCGHDLTDAIKAKFAQEGYSNGELAAALREELVVGGLLREALGYSSTPIRDGGGKFHGMHGRERAARRRTLVRGEGAVGCPDCGSPLPSRDSTCPTCGYAPPVPAEKGSVDVLAKLAEATATALRKPGAGAADPEPGGGAVGASDAPADGQAAATPASTPKQKAKQKQKQKVAAAAPEAAGTSTTGTATTSTAPGATATATGKAAPSAGGRWIAKGVGMQGGPNTLVKLAQQRLASIDPAYATDPDGMFGPKTEEIVKQFQREVGVPETGQLDPPTVQAMRNPPTNPDGSLRRAGDAGAEDPGGSGREGAPASSPARGGDLPDPSDPEAIKAWQEQHGIQPSGVVDRATQAAMRAVTRVGSSQGSGADAGMVRRGDGMQGQPDPKVRALQQKLASAGHAQELGPVDGRFGERTDTAVRKFQSRHGLRVDGVAGKQTQGVLDQVAANGGKTVQEATYYGVGPSPNFGTAQPFGGIVPILLADNLARALNSDPGGATLNLDPNMTEAAKAELRVREAREQRVEAERRGDTAAWHRARARELAAMEAADSLAKATVHEPVGKPGGPGLWHHKGLQLPAYIQHIANDLREKRGMTTSRAIATAIAAVKRWAAGGGNVDPGTEAAAKKALAEWEALKATH